MKEDMLRETAAVERAATNLAAAVRHFHRAVEREQNTDELRIRLADVREWQEALAKALWEWERPLLNLGLVEPPPANRFVDEHLTPICCRRDCTRVGVERSGDGVRWYCEQHWKEATNEGNPHA